MSPVLHHNLSSHTGKHPMSFIGGRRSRVQGTLERVSGLLLAPTRER